EDGIRDFHVTGVQTCALPISARQEGALCLNYARVESIEHQAREMVVHVQSSIDGKRLSIRTGAVINCTGPWVPYLGRITAGELRSEERRVGKGWRARRARQR